MMKPLYQKEREREREALTNSFDQVICSNRSNSDTKQSMNLTLEETKAYKIYCRKLIDNPLKFMK